MATWKGPIRKKREGKEKENICSGSQPLAVYALSSLPFSLENRRPLPYSVCTYANRLSFPPPGSRDSLHLSSFRIQETDLLTVLGSISQVFICTEDLEVKSYNIVCWFWSLLCQAWILNSTSGSAVMQKEASDSFITTSVFSKRFWCESNFAKHQIIEQGSRLKISIRDPPPNF